MTSRTARPRTLRFYQSANLKGRGSSGKFETRIHRETGSEQEKKFWESYVCVRNYSKLQKPYWPYRHFNYSVSAEDNSCFWQMLCFCPFCSKMHKLPYFNSSFLKNDHGDPSFHFNFGANIFRLVT